MRFTTRFTALPIAIAAVAISGCQGGDVTAPRIQGSFAPAAPIIAPTAPPTMAPTMAPTLAPTTAPTTTPTMVPTAPASMSPSAITFSPTFLSFPATPGSCPASYNTQNFAAAETGYTGTFSAVSSNAALFTVTPASGNGTFTVTDVMPTMSRPSATVTVSDTLGHSAIINLNGNLICL